MKYLSIVGLLFTISSSVNAQFWDVTNVRKIPGSINSVNCEESIPVFSKDSSTLYFVRTYHPKAVGGELDQDIWYSKRAEDGSYDGGKLLKDLNNKYFNAVLGLGNGGNTMYVFNSYDGKKDLQKGLAISTKKGTKWGNPAVVDIPGLDIDGDYYGFHVASSEDVVVISYAGPNSIGSEDLYVSTKQNGQWSSPMHMGNVINSVGFEISPFLSTTKDTLFFSSNGHGGFGDADIFYSVRNGNGWDSWSAPMNLGDKINSTKFDAYFSLSESTCYWSSNRDAERSDLYMAEKAILVPLKLICSGINVTKYNGSDGELNAMASGGKAPYTYQWSIGSQDQFVTNVKAGTYTVQVTDATGQSASCEVVITQPLIKKFDDIALTHYFEYNGDRFTISEGKLRNYAETIERQLAEGRESVAIHIFSSASYVPTETFKTNDNLARSRANRIKSELENYFTAKGYSSQVKIIIDGTVVQGPSYENDKGNTEKYRPFQYVDLKTK